MTNTSILSRPRYRRLTLDGAGRRHLLLCGSLEMPETGFEEAAAFDAVERWVVGRDHASVAALLAALASLLAEETMGLRLYVAGSEAFLWDVVAIGTAAGLGLDEIQLHHFGSRRRRVQCVHCRSLMEDVATSIVACSGCGAALFVRDHFSQRIAAFQGVQVDAEVPGERPAPQDIYL